MIKYFYKKIYFSIYYRIKKLKVFSFSYFFLKIFHKTPIINFKKQNIKFFVPNLLTYSRSKNLFKSEPETIEWINNFKNDAVFFDIGSNIGLYSIYACSQKKKISVYSFEPSTNNLRVLSKNIFLNNFQQSIKILPVPLSNKKFQFSLMKDRLFEEGGALNQYGVDFDFEGKKNFITAGNAYYTPGFSLDFLINLGILQIPNYIKIDVDGIEHLILEGCSFLKIETKTREIMVEINDNFYEQKEKILQYMDAYNFKLKKKFDNISSSKDFEKTFNYLFEKN